MSDCEQPSAGRGCHPFSPNVLHGRANDGLLDNRRTGGVVFNARDSQESDGRLADVALYGDAPSTLLYRAADEGAFDEYSTAAAAEQSAAVQHQAADARDAAVVTRILQKAAAEAPAEREKKGPKPRLNAEQLQSLAGAKS
jgi:hypothetical protein